MKKEILERYKDLKEEFADVIIINNYFICQYEINEEIRYDLFDLKDFINTFTNFKDIINFLKVVKW